ncbi:S-layer homology domain-containing protein, partial [Cohnella zeiphila]
NPGGGTGAQGENDENTVYRADLSDLTIQAGSAELELPSGKTRAVLTLEAAQALAKGTLTVKSGEASLAIDGRNLQALLAMLGNGDAAGASVAIELRPLPADEPHQASAEADGSPLKIASLPYELDLILLTAAGVERRLPAFDWPVSLTLPIDGSADKELLGLYTYDSASGQWTYIEGGKAETGDGSGGTWTAELPHFSEYAVFAYEKSFADVVKEQWYERAVAVLSAKHVAQGIDATHFGPNDPVTRAQFAALLGRALNLPSRTATFTDVAPNAWYAEAVSAVSAAGIMAGTGAGRFAPDLPMTREQMAVALAGAAKRLPLAAARQAAPFSDEANVSGWAKESVDLAQTLGLMNGADGNRFEPKLILTRAQAATAIYRLLQAAESAGESQSR